MITEKDVAKIARLARIRVTEEERAHFAAEISGILKWVEQLNEVDTSGIAPMSSVSSQKLPWRADEVTDGNQQQDIIANAPMAEHGCFVVPKVLE